MQSKSNKSPVRQSTLNSKIALATNMDEDISLKTRTNAASIAKEAVKESQRQIDRQQEAIVVALNKQKLSAVSKDVINKL